MMRKRRFISKVIKQLFRWYSCLSINFIMIDWIARINRNWNVLVIRLLIDIIFSSWRLFVQRRVELRWFRISLLKIQRNNRKYILLFRIITLSELQTRILSRTELYSYSISEIALKYFFLLSIFTTCYWR